MRSATFVVATLLTGLAATGVAAARSYLDGPPPAHTGGFSEPDCTACHFDNPINDDAGEVRISGFPEKYEPGQKYTITIEIRRPGMARGGFQAAIRHASGENRGRQAGTVDTLDQRIEIVGADPVRYLQHSIAGTTFVDDVAHWTFEWTAPVQVDGEVVLNAAANAANGDNSEFGDYIYLAKIISRARR